MEIKCQKIRKNVRKLTDIIRNENLSFKSKFLKTRFEFPKFDNFYNFLTGSIGGHTIFYENLICGFGENGSIIYFKELSSNCDAIEEFAKGANYVCKHYESN